MIRNARVFHLVPPLLFPVPRHLRHPSRRAGPIRWRFLPSGLPAGTPGGTGARGMGGARGNGGREPPCGRSAPHAGSPSPREITDLQPGISWAEGIEPAAWRRAWRQAGAHLPSRLARPARPPGTARGDRRLPAPVSRPRRHAGTSPGHPGRLERPRAAGRRAAGTGGQGGHRGTRLPHRPRGAAPGRGAGACPAGSTRTASSPRNCPATCGCSTPRPPTSTRSAAACRSAAGRR